MSVFQMAITDICSDHHHGHQDTVFTIKVPKTFGEAQDSPDAAVKKLVQCAKKHPQGDPGKYWGEQAQICDKKRLFGPNGITLKCMQKEMASNSDHQPECSKGFLQSPHIVTPDMWKCAKCRFPITPLMIIRKYVKECQNNQACVVTKLQSGRILTDDCKKICSALETSGIPDHIISGFIPLRSTRSQLIDFL